MAKWPILAQMRRIAPKATFWSWPWKWPFCTGVYIKIKASGHFSLPMAILSRPTVKANGRFIKAKCFMSPCKEARLSKENPRYLLGSGALGFRVLKYRSYRSILVLSAQVTSYDRIKSEDGAGS